MPRKRALIITYYWPPTGGPGVQRWLKFSKYMRQYGWDPVIYTPQNPERQYVDESLIKDIPEGIEIIKTPVFEPLTLAKMLFKKEAETNLGSFTADKKQTYTQRLLLWIRANVFIPDPRITWVKPSIRYLEKYLKEHPVDVVITSSTPWSMHLIGYGLKKKLNVKWLADFRDPWTQMFFFDELPFTKRSRQKHHALEKQVLQTADAVTVVGGAHTVKLYDDIYHRHYDIITNGYDADDYAKYTAPVLDSLFTLTHIGTLTTTCNHPAFWQALRELCAEIPGFKEDMRLRFVGNVPPSIFDSIRAAGLGDNLVIVPYMHHSEVTALQSATQVLLLIIARSRHPQYIVPGKIFEYLAAKRPILAVAPPNGDSANIIQQANAGEAVGFEDALKMKDIIRRYYMQYKQGTLKLDNPQTEQYTRENLTRRM